MSARQKREGPPVLCQTVPAIAAEGGFFNPRSLKGLSPADYDRAFGIRPLAGLDEAGRGPLAGPLVAAAAVLDPSMDYPGVTDSKKLGPEALREAYRLITRTALSWAVAVKSPAQVDSLNPLKASLLAMAEAWASLSLVPALTLADGTIVPPLPRGAKSLALAKGDSLSLCVGAASILAKATRDDIMAEMAAAYPGYGFERHKGYGTREHLEALSRLGPCPIHRLSYKRVASPRSRGLGF